MSERHFQIRDALESDAWAMIGVHFASVQAISTEHYSEATLLAWSPQPDEGRRQWLADLISRASTICKVAVSNENKILGFCIALTDEAQIKALYVHPRYSGHKLGQSLLQNVEAHCRTFGLEAIQLNASYNAEGFYRHCGYATLGPIVQSLSESTEMGALLMIKHLAF
jgi:putative acetyltransferase